MSKQCMVRREKAREHEVKKHATKRAELVAAMKNPEVDLETKLATSRQLQKLPKDSAKCRLRRRCWKTGRAHGVYRAVGMCRNMFRIHAMQGDIPGIHKASW